MAQANDSIIVTPGVGATVATQMIAGKEHQVMILCDESGHVQGSLPTYYYATPAAAVGVSKLYLDIFNATGSGKLMDIRGIWIIPKTDVAVAGLVAIRVDLYRTSAVGTGGTPWTYKSATIDVAGGTVNPCDTVNAAIPAQITGRHLLTGGATIAQWIFATYSLGEETATSQAYMSQYQNILPILTWGQKFAIRETEGMLLKQGTVVSVGNIGFLIAFTLE